jgi:DNA-binding Lrp family transcriptional regulator
LRDIELRLISELMKNSRRSDREIAKSLKSSQPTVSRLLKKLEKQGYIREFTAIPDFRKLGFEVTAITLIKLKTLTEEELRKAQEISAKDMKEKAPDEIVLFRRGMGGGYDGVIISLHKSYSDYVKLLNRIYEYAFIDILSTLDFIIDLNDQKQYRSLTFSTLARYLLASLRQEKE